MTRLIYNKKTINARKSFILAEDYAYPSLAGYIRDRCHRKGVSISAFIRAINEKYGTRYSRCFVRNLEVSLHHRTVNLGHFNMFAMYFDEDIFDVFEFCIKWNEKSKEKSLNL